MPTLTLHAASREALASAEARLDEVLGEASSDAAKIGAELLAAVDLLTHETALRRAVADTAAAPEARKRLVRKLLEGKVAEPTLKVLDTVAAARWSSPRELVDGLEFLGQSALLTSAEKAGNLETVEDELFRIARIVEGEPELKQTMSDQAAPAQAKREMVHRLFDGKVAGVTLTLVGQLAARRMGRGIGLGLDQLVKLAAERRERSVAYVESASALSTQQQEQLAEKLRGIYGRPMALHVEVDPRLGGGLVVRVGDEVIDGSVAGQVEALRRQLAS